MSEHLLKLTPKELDRYAPYHTWSEFTEGYDDYMLFVLYGHNVCRRQDGGVGGQAYDRGAECAMRRRCRQLTEQKHQEDEYNRDLLLRIRNGQVGSGMKHR